MAIHLARYGWHLAEGSHLAFGHGRGFIFNACARPLLVVTILTLVHHEMYQPISCQMDFGIKSRFQSLWEFVVKLENPNLFGLTWQGYSLRVPHFCNSICIWSSSFWPCRRIKLNKCLDVQRILQRTNLPRIVSQELSPTVIRLELF